jgi:hypothetical protein
MRRYGVTVHLSFGVLAQMLLTRELLNLPRGARTLLPDWIVRGKVLLMVLLLGLGLASIPVGALMADPGHARNVIEWNFAALMCGFYLLTWRAARATARRASTTPAG